MRIMRKPKPEKITCPCCGDQAVQIDNTFYSCENWDCNTIFDNGAYNRIRGLFYAYESVEQ